MAKTVSTTVLKAMTWGGRSYLPGATVALPVIDALTLKRKRLVSLTVKHTPPTPTPAATTAETPPSSSRRRYRRRDLQAEETSVGEAPSPAPSAPPPPAAPAAPDSPTPDEES